MIAFGTGFNVNVRRKFRSIYFPPGLAFSDLFGMKKYALDPWQSASISNLISIQSSAQGANKLNSFHASFWWKINKPNTWWAKLAVSGVISESELGGDFSTVFNSLSRSWFYVIYAETFQIEGKVVGNLEIFATLLLAAVRRAVGFIVNT